MNILALDPAKRTGWAWSDGKQLRSGVWLLGSHPAGRLERLDTSIRAAASRWRFEVLAYEAATFGSRHVHAMRRHNELAGVIQLCAARPAVLVVSAAAVESYRARKWSRRQGHGAPAFAADLRHRRTGRGCGRCHWHPQSG